MAMLKYDNGGNIGYGKIVLQKADTAFVIDVTKRFMLVDTSYNGVDCDGLAAIKKAQSLIGDEELEKLLLDSGLSTEKLVAKIDDDRRKLLVRAENNDWAASGFSLK